MKLRPYPEYQDSGLPWLGEIPAHWKVRRNGRLFSQRIETGFPELPVLEVSLRTGVRVRDMDNVARKQVMSDFAKYKRAAQGDIAYNMMRMWQGAVGIAPVDGLISPAYVIAKPRPEADSSYYAYLFRVGAYMQEVNKFSHGIVADRNRLYWEDFKQMPSIFPPRDEQEKIVAYLSVRDRGISHLIRAKRRLIELLTEQKQVIIHRAVTRGLDLDAKMQKTNLDWLPEVPEGWEVKPLKRWAEMNGSVLAEGTNPDYRFRYLDIGAVGTGHLTEEPELMRFENAPSRARRILKQGDTIISTVRTYLRAVYFIDDEQEDLIASTGFAVLTPCASAVPEYLSFVIQSLRFVERVMANSVGIAYPAIAESRLGTLHLAMPPTESEQKRIVEYIKEESKTIDKAIERARREIDLIGEYRTRLVSDVVTGRLDVRDANLSDNSGDGSGADGIEYALSEVSNSTQGTPDADL